MTRDPSTPTFEAMTGLILHRPHENTEALARQCARIGLDTVTVWPEIGPAHLAQGIDILFFDADMGHDGQFPWPAGAAPVPTIALIGSEAPGRITWAVSHGADAQLLKPIGSSGVYSALVIATRAFSRRKALEETVTTLTDRLANRELLAEATALLMVRHAIGAAEAYHRLRRTAMESRRSIDDIARDLLAETGLAATGTTGGPRHGG